MPAFFVMVSAPYSTWQGKSTISAVLCSGSLKDRITAHHFLKHNDQRRLEPVRIIKSLAFQLAFRCGERPEVHVRRHAGACVYVCTTKICKALMHM